MPQVWLVTGAGRGLGMAIAQAVLEAGHHVVATARNTQSLDVAFRHVAADRVLVAELDVTELDQAQQVARVAIDAFGRVDVLVNNAGYGQLSAFEETIPDEVRAQFETNLFGLMNVTRAVLPLMRAQRAGRIFNVASIGGYGSSNRGGVYSASKFAVAGFTESLAAEVAEFGISATVVAPGYFRTDFLDPSSAGFGGSAPIADYAASTDAFPSGDGRREPRPGRRPRQAGLGSRRARQLRQATRQLPCRLRRRRVHHQTPPARARRDRRLERTIRNHWLRLIMLNRGERRRGVSQVWTHSSWREASMATLTERAAPATLPTFLSHLDPAVDAGEIQHLTARLSPCAHRLLNRHRLRLQLSGGAHPQYARNLGTGEPLATGSGLKAAVHTIHHHNTRLTLPVTTTTNTTSA